MKVWLCKSARELLEWTQADLSEACGLSLITVKRYESALKPVSEDAVDKLRAALEKAGVEFIDNGTASLKGGEGVRLKRDKK